MAGNAGLSIQERLAMLQASNSKNPQLSGPMKTPPHVPQKTTTHPKFGAADGNEKPNGPATLAKSAANDPEATNEKDVSQFPFKLRPTGVQLGGKGTTPIASQKPAETAVAKVTPLVAKKPYDSPDVAPLVPKKTGGASQEPVNTTAVAMREKSNNQNTPRPPSIQERLAALKEKTGEASTDLKPKDNDLKSPGSSQKKFPVFPKANATGPNTGSGPVKPSDLAKSIKEAADRVRAGKKGSDIFLRHSDGKRFRKIEVASVFSSEPAPAKPMQIDNVDLTTFLQAYASAKETKLKADAAKSDMPEAVDGVIDELYVEAESTSVQLRIHGRGSVKRATSVRVSEIPEFTEEEEQEELYTDSLSAARIPEAPNEEYDDCASSAAQVREPEPEDPDEIYEPLDEDQDFPQSTLTTASTPQPADDKKGKKEKEKEKDKGGKKKDKAKEEANKKEEKERKKKEEEIKKQRTRFGLKDTDEKVGDGVVKNSSGAGVFSKDLAVSKGEIVSILRMDNNPAGKWLVQNEQGKLGFVNSNNIEVATPAIKQVVDQQTQQMMAGTHANSPEADEDPEELYEALPEGEMDEIYEEL